MYLDDILKSTVSGLLTQVILIDWRVMNCELNMQNSYGIKGAKRFMGCQRKWQGRF